MSVPFAIRDCVKGDAGVLANLVRELAVYEKLEEYVLATADDYARHLFGPRPAAEAILAEVEGEAVGFALFFTTFSTFRGSPGLYLEDIFVKEDHRGAGIGKALLATVAKRGIERGCSKVDWVVLNWNAPSIAFYEAAGARPRDDWTVYWIDGAPLQELAALAPNLESDGNRPG